MELTAENADRITALIQEAGVDGCPICLHIGALLYAGPPLSESQCCVPIRLSEPIRCSRNKYHLCSVEVVNNHDLLLVSIMDNIDRPCRGKQ